MCLCGSFSTRIFNKKLIHEIENYINSIPNLFQADSSLWNSCKSTLEPWWFNLRLPHRSDRLPIRNKSQSIEQRDEVCRFCHWNTEKDKLSFCDSDFKWEWTVDFGKILDYSSGKFTCQTRKEKKLKRQVSFVFEKFAEFNLKSKFSEL